MQDFKNMLTDRISKQREKFASDYPKPKTLKNLPVPGIKKYIIGITERNRKLTTVFSPENKTQYNISTVTFKAPIMPNSTTKGYNAETIYNITENKTQTYYVNETTFATSTTQATYKQKSVKVKEIKTIQAKTFKNDTENRMQTSSTIKRVETTEFKEREQNISKLQKNKSLTTEMLINNPENVTKSSTEDSVDNKIVLNTSFDAKEQNISKKDENKALQDEIVKKSSENVTQNSVDATTIAVIKETLSDLKENEQNITELVEKNPQDDEIVAYTSENVTENGTEITTENNDIQTTDSEAKEQTISTLEDISPVAEEIEESTPAGTTENIPEVKTQPIEEDSSDLETVTQITTSTTVQTTRTRLSVSKKLIR